MEPFALRPAVAAALRDLKDQNIADVDAAIVTDPDVLAALERLVMPGEDGNDVILRVIRGGSKSMH